MYSFKQKNFKYNKNNCWFASALIMEANNKTKKPITLQYALDIEQQAYDIFVMPKNWLTIKGWLDRVGKLTFSNTRLTAFWSGVFNMYLNKGYVLNTNIIINENFMNEWNSGKLIVWSESKVIWSHVICIYKKDWKYYFVNSWYGDNRDIREFKWLDLDIFKPYEKCGILF